MTLSLAKPQDSTAELYAKALAAASRATFGEVLALRAGGVELSKDGRAELLAKAVAREHVELELTLLAYEQKTGEANRNFVRFRDGAMLSLGRTGKGKPFLRDHRQWDVTARGGTILESKTVKLEDGHYRVEQTVRLTDPDAVQRALRGLMGSVSIGWSATGPVECSACGKPVLSRSGCWHWPGDEIKLDGGQRTVTVEWVYTSAELVETSEVSVPGVPSAGIEGVRAALSAALNHGHRSEALQENDDMDKLKLALGAILGLAATAGDDEVIEAVKGNRAKLDAVEAQNAELRKLQAKHAAEAEVIKAQLAAAEVDEFIATGVKDHKVLRGSPAETSLRAYFAVDKEGAKTLLATMPALPIGEELQSSKASVPASGAAASKLAGAAERIKQHNPQASLDGVTKVLASMGLAKADQDRVIVNQLAPKEV